MALITRLLFLIPLLPLLAAGIIAVTPRTGRRRATFLAIGSMVLSLVLSLWALSETWASAAPGHVWRQTVSFTWLMMGNQPLLLGWVLDPLTASMAAMVTLVGTLIFIFSVGYMEHDENYVRFFGFLALFAAAMLGLVIANSLLLLFICWELVGLASYLLIGFWYQKPSAAAAAKKAFITTRIGDLGFLLGMVWWYAETGTLLFYDGGNGCLEATAITSVVARMTVGGLGVSTAIGLLIFCGAMGKSGQVPLHVWLPDAMEGPTPVSALIHAATMVAAGVFLVARIFPLLLGNATQFEGVSPALSVIAWVGSITAVFAACVAVAQTDIKRILAYSTVSQLGYMMLALGVGGYVAGMFHLITHAFFKALLFLGAGSVIHGCHEEQDIRRLGGLAKFMPTTFLTYAIGMMALCGVPLFFSGFWSKDEILHQASLWPVSRWPFYLGVTGAFLTAFYMTRQVCYVFLGNYRGGTVPHTHPAVANRKSHGGAAPQPLPHESPWVMTMPLVLLAAGAILLGAVGTPAWPRFHAFLTGHHAVWNWESLWNREVLQLMGLSTGLVAAGIGVAWWLYGRVPVSGTDSRDILESAWPNLYPLLHRKFLVDEFYAATVIAGCAGISQACAWLERFVWGGCVTGVTYLALGLSWINRLFDDYVVNGGFNAGCGRVQDISLRLKSIQNGKVQNYLCILGAALAGLVLLLVWGGRR
jgi:NADH-quinone oxidoreductase subunit L